MRVVEVFGVLSKIHEQKDTGQIPMNLALKGLPVSLWTMGTPMNEGMASIGTGRAMCLVKRFRLPVPIERLSFHPGALLLKEFFFCLGMLRPLLRLRERHLLICYPSLDAALLALVRRLRSNTRLIVKMDSDGNLIRGHGWPRILSLMKWTLWSRVLAPADILTIESPLALERVALRFPQLREKLMVMSNGSDESLIQISRAEAATQQWSGSSVGTKKILFVGILCRRKGVDLLLDAAEKILPDSPEWRLVLVGPLSYPEFPGESEGFERAIENLRAKLHDQVVWLGFVDKRVLVREYQEAEIFVLPSRLETFTIAPVEAMSFGKAMIASDAGSASYMLDYGRAGLIFRNGDVSGLAAALKTLMNDAALREQLGIRSRQRWQNLFRWPVIIDGLLTAVSAKW